MHCISGKAEEANPRRALERFREIRNVSPAKAPVYARALVDGRRFGSGKLELLHVRSGGSDLGGDDARLVNGKARRARRCDGASEVRSCLSVVGKTTPPTRARLPGRRARVGQGPPKRVAKRELDRSSILAMDSKPRRG